MEKPDEAELQLRMRTINVFAHMVPEQKRRLVNTLKANGDPPDVGGDLEALSMDCHGPGAAFHLGFSGDGTATVDHGHELGEAMIRIGLCCMFRYQLAFIAAQRIIEAHSDD